MLLKYAGLAKHEINKGGFSVVNVGDDANISSVHGKRFSIANRAARLQRSQKDWKKSEKMSETALTSEL
ncbi:MAG: hypothetical protein A2428_00525 [Bdellovibrionales bacterium RIFOXYC1_FULL_54_43]|nr:MAG: hypothetical protein A2428_00525 [Bdellovibrionales bacterium RIFOXYC1_FULL_54_43]